MINIAEGVFFVGALHRERKLFDELIPLPYGTTYNAYLIIGKDKTALIDTVDPSKEKDLISNLKELRVEKIDYIVSSHAEQDHSGSIPKILETFPEAKVVTNEKCKSLLMDLLLIPENKFLLVKDGDELPLGGKTLKFVFTPWVHWPETMSTYLIEDKIFFTCDFFGSHYAEGEMITDGNEKVLREAKRYYAEIMMPFRKMVASNVKKIKSFEIDMIAPSHGPVYKKPEFIINAYEEWVSENVKNKVSIAFVSMHGSTEKIVEILRKSLEDNGITVDVFDMVNDDVGEFAISLIDSATVIIATPTVLGGAHPAAIYTAYLLNALKPKVKNIGFVTSYSWGGMALQHVKECIRSLNVNFMEPLSIKGYPKENDISNIKDFSKKIKEYHKSLGLL